MTEQTPETTDTVVIEETTKKKFNLNKKNVVIVAAATAVVATAMYLKFRLSSNQADSETDEADASI